MLTAIFPTKGNPDTKDHLALSYRLLGKHFKKDLEQQ